MIAALELAADHIKDLDGGDANTKTGWKSEESLSVWLKVRTAIIEAKRNGSPLEHLETLAEFIGDMENAELIDGGTVDVGPACNAYKALKALYCEAQRAIGTPPADLQIMTADFNGRG